jgi:hypothetical protein
VGTAVETTIICLIEITNKMQPWELQFLLGHDNCRQPQTFLKPEAAITVFELLMMSVLWLETC